MKVLSSMKKVISALARKQEYKRVVSSLNKLNGNNKSYPKVKRLMDNSICPKLISRQHDGSMSPVRLLSVPPLRGYEDRLKLKEGSCIISNEIIERRDAHDLLVVKYMDLGNTVSFVKVIPVNSHSVLDVLFEHAVMSSLLTGWQFKEYIVTYDYVFFGD